MSIEIYDPESSEKRFVRLADYCGNVFLVSCDATGKYSIEGNIICQIHEEGLTLSGEYQGPLKTNKKKEVFVADWGWTTVYNADPKPEEAAKPDHGICAECAHWQPNDPYTVTHYDGYCPERNGCFKKTFYCADWKKREEKERKHE